jgi:chitinase
MSLDGCNGQDCSSLGPQIKSCQENGKTIMLSVGGASGSYELTSTDDAKSVAKHLWNMFLNGKGETRPFGNGVVLDGIDFDVEKGAMQADGYWVTLINELRSLTKADKSKHYFLSGAPQCPFPDEWSVSCASSSKYSFRCIIYSSRFGPGPNTAVTNADLDFISIQFYNNGCGIQAFFGVQILGGGTFNFGQWSSAVQKANKNMKILLGIPASQAAGDGFESAANIKKIVDSIKNSANFAGKTCSCCSHYQ